MPAQTNMLIAREFDTDKPGDFEKQLAELLVIREQRGLPPFRLKKFIQHYHRQLSKSQETVERKAA